MNLHLSIKRENAMNKGLLVSAFLVTSFSSLAATPRIEIDTTNITNELQRAAPQYDNVVNANEAAAAVPSIKLKSVELASVPYIKLKPAELASVPYIKLKPAELASVPYIKLKPAELASVP
ncbi:hypothetical protein L9G74_10595, partial [Shewanella sp. C32]|nr:hypothetical protein [Shewanella electrica]